MRHKPLFFAAACIVGSTQLSYGADLPVKAPAYAPVAMYNWTGFYLGAQVGGGWASNTVTTVDPSASFFAGSVLNPPKPAGALGGIYGGYNYQIQQMLIGIDVDYSWASLTGGDASTVGTANPARTTTNSPTVKSLATVTGRLGYVFNNNWLFFGKAGWAWSKWDGASTTFNNITGVVTSNGSSSSTRNGWTLGTGVEWGFASNWSAKLEYDYVNFQTSNYISTDINAATGVPTPLARSATSYLNVVKVGVAYRF